MANERSLLIVAADPIATEGLTRIIDQQGRWKVLQARNSREAKTATETSRPDIILVDNKLPQLDGVRVTHTLLTVVSDSRILFLSEDDSMINSAFAAGVLGYLPKNRVDADLIAAIEQILLGRTFFLAQAVRLLRIRHNRNPYPGEHETLTPREVSILRHVALGDSNRETAEKLEISIRTVEVHRAALMEKLQLKNINDLVRYAIRTGIIEA